MQSRTHLSLVLGIFTCLFSNRWLEGWQKKWLSKKRLSAGPSVGRPPSLEAPGFKKKPAGGRFYERIFSLRVTLWYLIFQRLNFDRTLAGVVANLREGGADGLFLF